MGLALPLIALAAGTGLQLAGRAQATGAANRAYGDQLAAQKKFQGQSGQSFQSFLPTVGAGQAQLDISGGQAKRQQGYAQQAAQPVAAQPAQSPVLATRDQAAIQQQGTSRAKLGGYQDWQFQNAIRDLHEQQKQQQFGDFAGHTAALLPLQLQDASHAGDGLSGIGSLVGLAGALAGSGLFGGVGNAAPNAAPGPVGGGFLGAPRNYIPQ